MGRDAYHHNPGCVMSADETRATWVIVSTFATGLEADIARGVLEADGIPVLLQSDTAGIFGLAFQGNVAGGIALQVPSPEVERARALLDGDEEMPDEEMPDDAETAHDVDDQADGASDD